MLRRCCLGDVLLTTPLLRALDEAFPAVTIAYAVGPHSAAALANNPRVARLLPIPDWPTARQWLAIGWRWRRECFDLAVLPETSPLVHLAAALAGIPGGWGSTRRGAASR